MAKKPTKQSETDTPTGEAAEDIPTAPDPNVTDADILVGGPDDPSGGQPTSEQDREVELVEVEIGNQTFQVSKDVAEAYKAQQRKERTARQPAPEQPSSQTRTADIRTEEEQEDDDDIDTLLFTNPRLALEMYGRKIEDRVTQKLTQQYQQSQAQTQFWQTFYKSHPELEQDDFIVKSVLARDWDELSTMTGKDALDELADRSKEAVLAIAGRHGGAKREDRSTSVEGASSKSESQSQKQKSQSQPEGPQSLSAAIRQRKRQKSKAA